MTQARRAQLPLLAFALLATGIYAAEVSILRMRPLWGRPDLVALGVMLDLVVMVPLVYWFLAVRRGGWSRATLIPVVLLSILGAAVMLPHHHGLLRKLLETLAIPYEIGLVTWISVRTWRAVRRGGGDGDTLDTLERLRSVAGDVLPARRAAEAIAFEMAVLYYALFSWRRKVQETPGMEPFTYHRKGGYGAIVFAVLLMMAAEGIPTHVLVMRWSPVTAWVLTFLTAYGAVWFLADWRATRLRPLLLGPGELRLRVGLRWTATIPRESIAAVHKKRPPGSDPYLRASLPGATPIWIELAEPVTAKGPYGIEKRARWISLSVDDPERFRRALAADGT
jgi:hypothetical protein